MTAAQDKTNRATIIENDQVSISAAASVTFHMGSGTDSATNRYLNLPGGLSYGIEMIPTVACSITKINGKTQKVAISVGTGGYRSNNIRVTNITIQAGSATVVEVGGKC